jgi:hypothetical protein
MPDATKQILESLVKAKPLADLLRRDPVQLLATLANCEQGQAAIRAGTQVIGNLVERLKTGVACRPGSSPPAPAAPFLYAPPAAHPIDPEVQSGQSSSVAILGIASLSALAGTVAALGVVSIVALSKSEN